ncbi:MAG: hypothetical protein HYZ47_00500, partial [Simkania negevensis]|nr:hypothetical protein [Simkania negevensis]
MKKVLFSFITATLTATFLIAVPQAIVFDFGGVLTGESNREAVVTFIQESLHLSKEEFERANQEKRLAVQQGKTDEEFWLFFAKAKGIRLPANWTQSFKSVMKDAIGVNPQMYILVEELRKQHIPVALLSNIDKRLSNLIRDFKLYEPNLSCSRITTPRLVSKSRPFLTGSGPESEPPSTQPIWKRSIISPKV